MSGHSNHAHDEDDMHTPILPGRGASDYERYLRTDDLLALQKEPGERIHRDELLFQTVHQASNPGIWPKPGACSTAVCSACNT
jgi:tryptophan 2,3-dioxygenase